MKIPVLRLAIHLLVAGNLWTEEDNYPGRACPGDTLIILNPVASLRKEHPFWGAFLSLGATV
jgi:hypothetical protein